jgi:hypothetical protein
MSDWDYLYGALELFTHNRKRNQIVMLQDIIFRIKESFNKEFEDLMKKRQNQIDAIGEKNKRIIEILQELKKEPDVFKAKPNMLENPERILTVE